MKKLLIEVLSIIIVFTLVISCNIKVFATTQSELNQQKSELNSQKNEINSQIQDAESDLTNIKTEKSQTLQEVESLIQKISGYQSQVDELKSEVGTLQSEIDQTQKDIDEKQKEYKEQSELLDQRMIAVYENGETSYLDFILSSSNLVDFISNYYLASEVASCDTDLISSIEKTKNEIEEKKSSLEEKKTEVGSKLKEVESVNIKLQADQVQKNAKVASLSNEEKQTQVEIEKLQNDQDKITKEIKAAEAKYQAELEAIKKNQNQNKGNSGSSYNDSASSGFLQKPVQSGSITTNMYYSSGRYHGAIDYGVPVGTTVYAAADGVVLKTGYDSDGYGNYIVIQHLNKIQTWYGHGNGTFYVSVGQTVSRGQAIMQSGNTGNSTGPHLHFEVRVSPYNWLEGGNDSRRDPRNYF